MGSTVSTLVATDARDALTNQTLDGWGNVEFTDTVLNRGACRIAFKGTIEVLPNTHVLGQVSGWRLYNNDVQEKQSCVVKVFHTKHVRQAAAWKDDALTLQIAYHLAIRFNHLIKGGKRVKVASAIIAEIDSINLPCWPQDTVRHFNEGDLVFVEPFLEGTYQKFMNNYGWFARKPTMTLEALAHFSWAATEGQILLCDLQGIRESSSYLITDPALCSQTMGFCGPTDMGIAGQRAFFIRHKCNNLCQGLPRLCAYDPKAPKVVNQSTSFTVVDPQPEKVRVKMTQAMIALIEQFQMD